MVKKFIHNFMTTYESKVKSVAANDSQIFAVLSNMNNLQRFESRLPKDKIQDFKTTQTTCSFSVSPFGNFEIAIVEATPKNTIKYGTTQSPMQFNVWVQLKQIEPGKCALKLTMKIDLNFMLKAMVGKYLEEYIDKAATVLASLPYAQLSK